MGTARSKKIEREETNAEVGVEGGREIEESRCREGPETQSTPKDPTRCRGAMQGASRISGALLSCFLATLGGFWAFWAFSQRVVSMRTPNTICDGAAASLKVYSVKRRVGVQKIPGNCNWQWGCRDEGVERAVRVAEK